MAGFTRRTYLRRYLKAPIEFRERDQAEGQQALVFDCCRGGMHFISDDYIEPGAVIFVHPSEPLNACLHVHGESGCPARVVWCRRCSGENQQGFSIGIKFTPHDESGPQPDIHKTLPTQ